MYIYIIHIHMFDDFLHMFIHEIKPFNPDGIQETMNRARPHSFCPSDVLDYPPDR
jgi:hypothetical protein